MPAPLIEFPADDAERALRFWPGVLGIASTALDRVRELGGSVVHPRDRWAVCRDSEGSRFALAAADAPIE